MQIGINNFGKDTIKSSRTMKVGNRCLRLMDLEHLSIQTAASEEIQVVSKDEECVSLDIVLYLKQGAGGNARSYTTHQIHLSPFRPNLPTYLPQIWVKS